MHRWCASYSVVKAVNFIGGRAVNFIGGRAVNSRLLKAFCDDLENLEHQ